MSTSSGEISQKRLITRLLETGRWKTESEIIQYGLHLVAKEVESDSQNLAPYPPGLLSAAYRIAGEQALAEDRALSNASAVPTRNELG